MRLLVEFAVAALIGYILINIPGFDRSIVIPFFKNISIDLGILYVPFAMLVIVGSANAVNLTDGLDGLAIGPCTIAAATYLVFAYVTGNIKAASYLQFPFISGVGELSIFLGALVGAGMGFLWYNAYPAQVFMGDVGSLSLGDSGHGGADHQTGGSAAGGRRNFRYGGGVCHPSGGILQVHERQTHIQNGPYSPSLRAEGVAGTQNHRAVLDRLASPGAGGHFYSEVEVRSMEEKDTELHYLQMLISFYVDHEDKSIARLLVRISEGLKG